MGCSQSSAALTSENSTVQLSAEDKQKIDELQEQRNQLEQQQQQVCNNPFLDLISRSFGKS